MTLASVVRRAVAKADRLTRSLQAQVDHVAWTGQDGNTKPTYASAVKRSAIIEQGPVPFRTAEGETIAVKAVVHILETVEANGASDRKEPIDPRDRITLPDGTVGAPIMGAEGVVDPSTGKPYMYTVALG